MSKDSKGGSSNDSILVNQSYLEKPKSLLDAIKDIQNIAAMEMATTEEVDPMFFSLKDRMDFMIIGIKNSFYSGFVVAILTPFAVGVLEKMIPLFGEEIPSLFNQIYALLLALGYSLGYALFLATLKGCYVGNLSKIMIRNLLGGIIFGAVAKTILAVVIFHFIYLSLTPTLVITILNHFKTVVSPEKLNSAYFWIMNFKPAFLTSSWVIIFSTILFVAIPVISITLTSFLNRKRDVRFNN